jgi:hypothetical protein
MNFHDTVQRAIEIYKAQVKKNLCFAASDANDEAGGEWNVSAVQTAAHKIIFA